MEKQDMNAIMISAINKGYNENFKLCIYCLGEYGMQMYFKLKEYGIKVDFFGDSDKRKQGYALDHIYCYSFDEIKSMNEDIVVIVSMKNPDILIDKMKSNGFQYVLSNKQMQDIIHDFDVIKIDNSDAEYLDYSKDEYVNKIQNFKNEINNIYFNYKSQINMNEKKEIYKPDTLEAEFENVLLNYKRYLREKG